MGEITEAMLDGTLCNQCGVLIETENLFAMSRAMPALNLLGATYVGVVWPGSLFCAASRIPGCTTTPTPGSLLANSLFTFR